MRFALAAIVVVVALTSVPAGASQPPPATPVQVTPASQHAAAPPENNTTVERLRSQVKDLRNENSQLKTKVVSLNGQVQKLQFRQNQSNKETGFSPEMAQRLREMGAWDSEKKVPALVIVRDQGFGPVVYQFVGPGNGDVGFNGQDAWIEVAKPTADVRYEGQFSFTLRWIPPGMERRYNTTSFADYRGKTRTIANQLNTPAGFTAWSRWTNEQRHSAESFRGRTVLSTFVIGLALVAGAMWIESKQHLVLSWRKDRKQEGLADQMDRRYRPQIRRVLRSIPVLGRLLNGGGK